MTDKPATGPQLWKLNTLGLLQLGGEIGEVTAEAASRLLAETAEKGLWTPRSPTGGGHEPPNAAANSAACS